MYGILTDWPEHGKLKDSKYNSGFIFFISNTTQIIKCLSFFLTFPKSLNHAKPNERN